MSEGWISLHRKIRKNWVWQDAEFLKIWVDLLLSANHADKKILINGHLVEVKRGEFVTSLKKLAKEYNYSIKRIRRFLILCELDSMIVLKNVSKMDTHNYM
jgi:DNA replication protein DnaD